MAAIVAQGISKKFRMSQSRSSIKDRLFHRGQGGEHQDFWALREVDVTIEEGETVGILGHNGSGKSTMLKCIAGILKPTTGIVQVRGRVASLLELGAGFHPDLTGRENVFINAAFLGISKREIERRFDDIVGFAELERFIDQQVKYYSSGMFVRLGFAVAINVDPDVLLIDEVLAVGDEAFQQKCLERVEDFQREGRTILFVTHGAEHVRRICSRAMVLDHGEMVANAVPGEAIRIFREHLHGTLHEAPGGPVPVIDSGVKFTALRIEHDAMAERTYLLPGESVRVIASYEATRPVHEALLALELHNQRGELVYGVTSDALGVPLPDLMGTGQITIDFASMPLLDGNYPIALQLRHHHDGRVLAMREGKDRIEVMNPGRQEGLVMLPATVRVGGLELRSPG